MAALMAGDPANGGGWFMQTLLGRIDRVSDEFRGDLHELRNEMASTEKRVTGAIDGVRREFVEYSKVHAAEHVERRAEIDGKLATLGEFMKARELRQAREDGALGVIRFLLDTAGRNWQLIATLLAFLGLALGNVRIDIGQVP